MNPLTYISNISRNNRSNVDIINNSLDPSKPFYQSPEIVALFVFGGIYILIRLIETYILPMVPEFLTREVSSLYRWGPVLVPIIFGVTFFSKRKKIKNVKDKTYDDILKERMLAWAN